MSFITYSDEDIKKMAGINEDLFGKIKEDDSRYDLTDIIAEGNIDEIISELNKVKQLGCSQIHFNGYDAEIYAYAYKECPDAENKTFEEVAEWAGQHVLLTEKKQDETCGSS